MRQCLDLSLYSQPLCQKPKSSLTAFFMFASQHEVCDIGTIPEGTLLGLDYWFARCRKPNSIPTSVRHHNTVGYY